MKRIISILLATSILMPICTPVLARDNNPLEKLIDVELFDKEGSTYTRAAYQEWLNQALPEVLVDKVLVGNYGFVAGSKNFWNIDKKSAMSKPALMQDGKIQIPAEIAQELFGIAVSGAYTTVEDIVAKVPKYKSFTDPRGFALITEDLSVIDKKPAIEGNIGGRHYRSYYDVSMCMSEITWEDAEPTSEEFALIRKRVADGITLDDGAYDEAYVQAEINAAKNSMSLFNKSGENPIFAENPSITVMFHYYQTVYQWGRTHYMLKKLGRNDIDLNELKSDIQILLKYLYDNNFGVNAYADSNWYYNRISYPSFIAGTLACMYDELPKEDLLKYANTMLVRAGDNMVSVYCVPFKYYTNGDTTDPVNAYSNYTNLLWQTYVNLLLCCITEDGPRANHTIKYASQAFEMVKNGADVSVGLLKDGVYEDGSFVFHAWYAYNLGYGKSYACNLADLVQATQGTSLDIQKTYNFKNVYSWIEKSWLPFLHGNMITHIVQGRENPVNSGAKANSIVTAIMLLVLSSGDEDLKHQTATMLKPIISDYMEEYRNLASLPNFSSLTYPNAQSRINDYLDYIEALPETKVENVSDVYYNMDKVVHQGKNFKFMLSMASERIDRYEAINSEGYTDWYTSDGMTYTLLDDNRQYVGEWWNYVDRYMIPGTTADKSERNPKYSSYGTVMPNNSWAGAATDGKITVASQQLTGNAADRNKKLEAWKSWFMLEDKIVCLGTGITGGKGSVSTIVENALLCEKPQSGKAINGYPLGYEDAVIDGTVLDVEFDKTKEFESPSWAWIEPNRGFLFIGENSVVAQRVAENKAFAGLSEATKNTEKSKPFMTLHIDHGEDVKDESYAYAIIPGATKEETEAISENPGFEILSKTKELHAIKENATGTIMASVMQPSEIEGFKFLTPCCAILKPDQNGNYTVYVSDPTQKIKTIRVQIPEGLSVKGSSIYSVNGNDVEVRVDSYYGKTYSFTCGSNIGDGTFENSEYIITADLTLKCGKGIISTNLYAENRKTGSLQFSIYGEPENCTAFIRDGRLYIIPNIFSDGYVDEIVIEVSNEHGDSSRYTVTVIG